MRTEDTRRPPRLVWTRHAAERARWRGVGIEVAELAFAEGDRCGNGQDRYLLTKATVRMLRREGFDPSLLAKAELAAPIVAVVREGVVVTVLRPSRSLRGPWRLRR